MIVVSDTSPIFNLAAVGKLHLLSDLYAETRVVAAQNQNNVAMLRGELDPGEAEAIVVAVESEADPLLVDERIPGMKRGPAAATAAVYVSLETGKLV